LRYTTREFRLNQKRGPLALIIIDGWGYSPRREGNAIALAATPYYDEFCENYPQTLLEASGTRVGLPAGVMGNSEVGHLNIGAGRVIRMDVSRVDHDISTGGFFKNEILLAAIDDAKQRGAALHLMGLLSDGQVHSSQEHLYALLRLAKQRGLERVFVHCFLDGRDTPPSSAATYIAALQKKIEEIGCGEIATLSGLTSCSSKAKANALPIPLLPFGVPTRTESPTSSSNQLRLSMRAVGRRQQLRKAMP
jgi:2,3-bisphosphoglycerate-independent phosphoglycerate mutase